MKLKVPVIGILRGIEAEFFSRIMEASFTAGLDAIEVTMNTAQAERIVSDNRADVPAGKLLGMGTIRNKTEAKEAHRAGAMFFVTPNIDLDVIEYAKSYAIPIVCGALTPTEVHSAWKAGADMIKVFPCKALGGPSYIKDLLGPFDKAKLVAVGGVTMDNLAEYFKAGAAGVGVSAALFGRKALEEKNSDAIGKNVKMFIDRCLSAKDGLLSSP